MNRKTSSWRGTAWFLSRASRVLLLFLGLSCRVDAQPPLTFVTAPAKPAAESITEEAGEFRSPPRETSLLPAMIYSAAVSPDEKWIAVGTSDWTRPGDVILFRRDAPTEKFSPTSRVVRRFGAGVRDVAFSADSRYLAAAIFTNDVWVLDLSNMKTVALWRPSKQAVNSVSFSSDGRWLATGSLDKTVCVWSLIPPEKESDGLALHAKHEWHTESVFTTAFAPDSGTLLSAGRDQKVIAWNLKTREQIAAWKLPNIAEHLTMSPNGETFAVGVWSGKIELRRCDDGVVLQTLDHLPREDFTVTRVAFSPDGEQLASVATDGQVKLWRCKDGSLIRSWEADKDRCWAVQFTAAGQQLMTGGADGTLKVWDHNTEKMLFELQNQIGLAETTVPMTAAGWSPRGIAFATAHLDNSLRVRRAASGISFGETRDLPEVFRTMSVSPVQAQVAGAGEGPLAYLIGVSDLPPPPGQKTENPPRKPPPPIQLKGHTGRVRQIAYAADGLTVFTVSDDGTVRHWDAFTGLPGPVRNPQLGPLSSLACTADGRWLVAAGQSGSILFWDLRQAGLQPSATITGSWGGISALTISSDGTQLAISAADKTIRLWTLPAHAEASVIAKLQGTPPRVLTGFDQPATVLRFSPLATWLASDGPDKSLRLWKVSTGELGLVIPPGSQALDVAFSSDGRRITRVGDNSQVLSWDGAYAKLKPIATLNLGDGVRFLAFTPDQTQAVIGTLTATVHLWDLQTGKITKGHCSEGIADGALSADGKTLATIGFSGDVALWSVSPPKVIATLKRGVPVKAGENEGTSIAISADGQRLATGTWDGAITVWDVPNRKELHRLPQQELPVEGLRFSPDGNVLVSATGSWKEWQKPGTIKLWNVSTGKEVASLPGPRHKIRRVAFSRDGNTLIAGGSQNEILRYDLKDGAWFQTPSLTTFGDNAVVEFVGDNTDQIVSGTSDGGVTLWSTQSRARRDGMGHRTPKSEPVAAAAVSRDGSLIATGSSAGEVHFYLTPGAPAATVGTQLSQRKIPGVVAPIIEKKPGG